MMLDPLLLSRLQFVWVIARHILLPAFTVGLASYIAVMEGMYFFTRRDVYFRISGFWTRFARAVLDVLSRYCDDIIGQKGAPSIDDLMFQSDPQVGSHRHGWGQSLPVIDDRRLNPLQISGVIDVSHEVDVARLNGNRIAMEERFGHLLCLSMIGWRQWRPLCE